MKSYKREDVMTVTFIIFIIAVSFAQFETSDSVSAIALISGTIVAYIMAQEFFE